MRAALSQRGHHVLHAPDAETALGVCRKGRLSLVLLDVALPGMNGLEFLRRFRSESQVPVVLMSGQLTAANRTVGLHFGAYDCLRKPFTIQELLACVDRTFAAV